MEILKVFFANICLLVTLTYLLHLSYQFFFSRLSDGLQYITSILWYILAGWLCMFFAFEVGDARFDLRYVPLIFGILVFPSRLGLLLIGAGIGLLRLTFGTDAAGMAGFANMLILGAVSAYLAAVFEKRKEWTRTRKAVIAVLVVNAVNIADIALLGVLPAGKYLSGIAPVSFTVSVLLSFFFYVIIRDLEREENRMRELSRTNRILRTRTDELYSAKEELERKAEQLEAVSQYKSDFLNHMSHELNIPLHSILQLSRLQAETGTPDNDRRRYGEIIHQSGQDMLGIVNDVLDLSKAESGKLELNNEMVSLVDFLQTLEEQCSPLAARKGLEYRAITTPDAPAAIRTDPFRLHQILHNMMINSISLTNHGHVELILSRRTAEDGTAEAVFQVRDTGTAGDPQRGTNLEPFPQEGELPPRHGGSGLGLAVSRQLAELMGGRLEWQCGMDGGSCFTLALRIEGEETGKPQRRLE